MINVGRRFSAARAPFRASARWLAAALFALALTLTGAASVAAHADLIGADPAPGSTVTGSPSSIRLSFSQPLLRTSLVELSTGLFQAVPGVTTQVAGSEMRAIPAQPLPPAIYTVQWIAFSVDGHSTQGSYQFGVAEATLPFGGRLAPLVAAIATIMGGAVAVFVWILNRRQRL